MDVADLVQKVVTGPWSDRIAAIRSVPAEFPGKQHQTVYAEVSRAFYAKRLGPHFHLVPWLPRFLDRAGFESAYQAAEQATKGFSSIGSEVIAEAIKADGRTLRVFRLIMGYTPHELSDALNEFENMTLGDASIHRLEDGGTVTARTEPVIDGLGRLIATIISGGGYRVSEELRNRGFLGKAEKPDTQEGWTTVERFARDGVPYHELLYQRWYGGAFRQLQDAGGRLKGDILEDATEDLFKQHGIPHVRTVQGTQATAGDRFGIQVLPAPDFILHDGSTARGLLECKSAGDGGTARDKAGRFHALRAEANRLGGVPVLAVLEGFGWRRVNDALGPVVRDCDGRVFTPDSLHELLDVDPASDLMGTAV